MRLSDLPTNVILAITSYLDVESLLNFALTSKSIHTKISTRVSIEIPWKQLRDQTFKLYNLIYGHQPKQAPKIARLDQKQRLLRTRSFHRVINALLQAINYVGDTKKLNIVTGEDLLYSVGRLSYMINDIDFLPDFDTRADLPVNWSEPKYLKLRNVRQKNYVNKVTDSVAQHRKRLLEQTLRFRSQEYYRAKQPEIETASKALLPLLRAADDTFERFLGDQRYLAILTLVPPACLLNDPIRKPLATALAYDAVFKLTKKDLQQNALKELLVPYQGDMGKKQFNILTQKLSSDLKDLHQGFGGKPGDLDFTIRLPIARSHECVLTNLGSIRLIFSQGAEIMSYIGDTSRATDLSYERIRDALSKPAKQKQVAQHFRRQFGGVYDVGGGVLNYLFGELALLLVGIEGTQNNLSVLHAPMCADLVCLNQMTWGDFLCYPGHADLPWFGMAADAVQKGSGKKGGPPLQRQSQVLKSLEFSDDDKGTYDQFQRWMGRELELEDRFLATMFPRLEWYSSEDQLRLSTIFISLYLTEVFRVRDQKVTKQLRSELANYLRTTWPGPYQPVQAYIPPLHQRVANIRRGLFETKSSIPPGKSLDTYAEELARSAPGLRYRGKKNL